MPSSNATSSLTFTIWYTSNQQIPLANDCHLVHAAAYDTFFLLIAIGASFCSACPLRSLSVALCYAFGIVLRVMVTCE